MLKVASSRAKIVIVAATLILAALAGNAQQPTETQVTADPVAVAGEVWCC